MSESVTVTVYTREQCHLCEKAIRTIRSVAESVPEPVTVDAIDVDRDSELRAEYGNRVPYIFVDDRPAFKFRVDAEELRSMLAER